MVLQDLDGTEQEAALPHEKDRLDLQEKADERKTGELERKQTENS